MPTVLDACAIIAFLRDEEGAGAIEEVLLEADCHAHAVNVSEVYKDCLQRGEDLAKADDIISDLRSAGINISELLDEAFWKHIAIIKNSNRIAFADCFALALSGRLNAEVLTSDHEFDSVAESGLFSIRFFR